MIQGAKGRGPEFVCATMNDCQQHMNYLLTMSEEILKLDEVRSKVDPLIDSATKSLTRYGEAGVRALSHVVMQDLSHIFATLFGPEWLDGESRAAVVTATFNDYLGEYEDTLVDYYLTKVSPHLHSGFAWLLRSPLTVRLIRFSFDVRIGHS